MRLAGRVVLITGGAKRIGRALALALARRATTVAFTYHTSETDARRLVADLHRQRHQSLAGC